MQGLLACDVEAFAATCVCDVCLSKHFAEELKRETAFEQMCMCSYFTSSTRPSKANWTWYKNLQTIDFSVGNAQYKKASKLIPIENKQLEEEDDFEVCNSLLCLFVLVVLTLSG